jgi:Tfp pilus assembly protein PilN
LGIALTPRSIEAVLLRKTDDGLRTAHRMVRTRSQISEAGSDYSTVLPGLRSSDDSDFTLEIGSGGGDLDLHFDDDLKDLSAEGAQAQAPRPFAPQLREILLECAELGHPSPELAFCIGAPDVSTVPLSLPAPSSPDQGDDQGWMTALTDAVGRLGSPWSSREKMLHTKLRAAFDGAYDPQRAVFLPMGADAPEGERRFLAVVPTPAESVSPTLRSMADDDTPPLARLMEAEATLYADYVARDLAPAEDETTVVVRVGHDDSLLLFLKGARLVHTERLPSLTTFDPPDMISSRVLLHLDDQKVGDADHVLLASGPRDDRLAESLRRTFSTAAVHRLADDLADEAPVAATADTQLPPQSGPAMLAALRLLVVEDGAPDRANLLERSLRTRRSRVSLAWHTVLVLALLFVVSAFFGWRYMDQQQAIRNAETVLATSPDDLPALSAEALEHKVDSLDAVHERYTRALYVLDSLLLGSDEWSRSIEKTASLTGSIRGIWFETWSLDPSSVEVRGHALDRGNLARLARRLDAVVEEIGFSEIGNRRVYPFAIRFPRTTDMPEVALALREQALTPDAPAVADTAPPAAPVRPVASPQTP